MCEVYEARALFVADGKLLVERIGESSASALEWLGDTLNGLDAVEDDDAWIDPIIEAAQARWPAQPVAEAVPASGAWQQAVLNECMKIEAAYVEADPEQTISQLIDWHAKNAASNAAAEITLQCSAAERALLDVGFQRLNGKWQAPEAAPAGDTSTKAISIDTLPAHVDAVDVSAGDMQAVRNAALEEAAESCEARIGTCEAGIEGNTQEVDHEAVCCAADIRALKGTPAAATKPRPMHSAPKDGTLVRLLVQFEEHSLEDDAGPLWTIGANGFEADGIDEWKFAGWCWSHDHFTQGVGKPVGWLPFIQEVRASVKPPHEFADDDMAEVGRAVMQAIESHAPEGWHPADCPSEIVGDLRNMLDEAQAAQLSGNSGEVDAYLCKAWGETDLPAAAIVNGLNGVRAFLIAEWLGEANHQHDDGTNSLDAAMQEMREGWELEGTDWEWSAEFEIGGISVQRVGHAAIAATNPAQPLSDPKELDAARYLQEDDYHLLYRFIETTDDNEGYDIGKAAIRRLSELGVVQSHGFGRYSVTAFGYYAHETYWHQDSALPLMTNSDRDERQRAAIAAMGGENGS